MSCLSLVFLTLVAGAQAAPQPPAGWVARPLPTAGRQEWRCANQARDEWTVSAEQGKLAIAKAAREAAQPSLPFTPQLAPGEAPNTFRGLSALQTVSDGFLAGFSRGEFGGGLYWFSADGAKHLRITVMSASWFPENVIGIVQDGRAFLVFQGLAHIRSRRGRVLKVQQESGRGWVATVLTDLGSAPAAVLEEVSGIWLVVTSDGLSRVTSRGTAQRLWNEEQVGYLYPSSIVRTSDGVVYIGMRAWVARLRALNPGPPLVDLLTPASCVSFAGKGDGPCGCLPAKGDGGAR
jgi:hypothetical protein